MSPYGDAYEFKKKLGKMEPVVWTKEDVKFKTFKNGGSLEQRKAYRLEIPGRLFLLVFIALLCLYPEPALAFFDILKDLGFLLSDLRGTIH